ncbi:hypothetical protein SPRG_16331 [Saprolegnia parasitica CBS 223.65]|uniref:Uncharacterized protein n=1 Tax=Saprolegnia parasitica (strain CBS 223.65) TaxID=695850 RepID=A0A067BJA2_SAPPC|nr:hypothetical protein SPRG_16331 [Saprolegnia parasitica CBS 223.65]KDO18228.1 hypothetical protein SPRG_16331 [Saprolegnia parasitica CBS 223.65]|eukprot:XP_012211061.1 hypothetical protein SPRG_16331 [Saprolegnia parasitica CBS 223.65]
MKSPTQAPPTKSHAERTWHIIGIVAINIAMPIGIYNYMKAHTSEIYAVALSGVPPMLKTVYEIFAHNRKDLVSFMQIFSMIFSLVLLSLTTDPRVLMAKDSCTTIFFGSMHFLSLTWKEDLFFSLRRQITDKSKEEMDAKWANPKVREVSRFLCIVWGTFMITDAIFRIVLIYLLSVSTIVLISPFIGITLMASLGYWTFRYISTHEDGEDEEATVLLSDETDAPHANYSTKVASAC